VNRGKSGTLHMAVPDVNALMTSTVVGAGPPMAAGAAFAQQYRDESAITAVFFGDGAAAEGSVHEAMNLAGTWDLPLLFICENNCWAGAQGMRDHCSVGSIMTRAASYGMPGELADGNDADEVYEVAARLAEHCRSGQGPALMEAVTYRMRGHGEADHQHYVDPAEIELWAGRDPIRLYTERLIREEVLDQDRVRDMEQEARNMVDEALEFAERSPYPPPEEAVEHVWAQDPWNASS
jgi:pyruvate dehydrogenase E1 component alpha subunit